MRDIVGLTSMHSSGSGTSLLEDGWTWFYALVVPGERQRAGMGLLIAPWFLCNVLDFTPVDKRVASLHSHVGKWVMTVVCA